MLDQLYATFFTDTVELHFYEWVMVIISCLVLVKIFKTLFKCPFKCCKLNKKEESFCCSRKDEPLDV